MVIACKQTNDVSSLSLPFDVGLVSEGITVPLPYLQGIWKKATDLLNTPRATTLAPGHPEEAKMVISTFPKRIKLVNHQC